jgi:hypothetical protein
MDKKQSKQKIESLVQTFHTEKHEKMNEAETRLRFINPFFEALGWNILNPKEVRVETPTSRSDSTRPDYRFLIDGKTKFFVEAKKPSVKLTDPTPVFQAKSYGFSSKVPIVILTDFEEFRPFRTLARPKYEKPLDGLIREFDLTYDRYVDQFNPLYDTFSHDAVFAGELEKRIPTEKKEASTTVDKEFLKDLSKWQEELAKNIALRNSRLSVSEINEAVQRILDRIIFLRICEDRQIEESEILLSYANSGDDIYRRLLKEFTRLRAKYNGLIFNEHRLSEQLSIDDKLLKEIIVNLYLPRSPYRFNVIPIEILGTIYEQYLGRIITLTPTHRVKVEVKPEVRKAGGVFYTPQFITSCIVKNTIGKLIAGKTPEQIAKLKFIDITCGSGSFCLEMFDYLIHYHIDYYSSNPDKIKTVGSVPDAFQTSEAHLPDGQGLWHLSTRKKKEILLNNIYGVDIDPQAVEVTQMSLYLKLLEGESAETFGKQLSFELKETILPNLSNNIKCGNSLVGMDILDTNKDLFGETIDPLKIRPFDWQTGFPEVMKNGGFDAIVGNPPYISIEDIIKDIAEYFLKKYKTAHGRVNSFSLFFEQFLSLSKKGAQCGFIVSNRLLTNTQLDTLRGLILNSTLIDQILSFKKAVFDAAVDTIVIVFQNRPLIEHPEQRIRILKDIENVQEGKYIESELNQSECLKNPNYVINLGLRSDAMPILGRIQSNSVLLESLCDVKDGIILGAIKDLFLSNRQKDKRYKRFLDGSEVSRYSYEWTGRYICYDKTLIEKELQRKKEKAKGAETRKEKKKLQRSGVWLREGKIFDQTKILTRQNAKRIIGTFDDQNFYVKNSLHSILQKDNRYDLKFILGLLNSRLLDFYFQNRIGKTGEMFSQMKIEYIKQLPIRTIDFNNPDEKVMHDRMVQLVERMLDLHKKKQHANSDSEKELFEHQIKATDKEIDELVYKLYGLTEEEIKVVEGGSTGSPSDGKR